MGAAGIGLRAPHYAQVLERRPALSFLEVHSENFFADGGRAPALLERFRAAYPLSLHGVGLSLGSVDPLDEGHVRRLLALVRRFEPMLVSEHLSWSSFGGRFANDLLPLPHTPEAAAHVAARIARLQDRLGREVLVENVSSYRAFAESTMPEWEFVAEVVRRAGCGLLLDVNNVHVNAVNHGFAAADYLAGIPRGVVREMHVAGHERTPHGLLDTHAAPVSEAVWELHAAAVRRFGAVPTLVERDANLPPLDELVGEARRAAESLRVNAPTPRAIPA